MWFSSEREYQLEKKGISPNGICRLRHRNREKEVHQWRSLYNRLSACRSCSSQRFSQCPPRDFVPIRYNKERGSDRSKNKKNKKKSAFFPQWNPSNPIDQKREEYIVTLRISQASPAGPSPVPPEKSNSSSELSLQFPLKQLHRFIPHLACFSLLSSMKFSTILSKQTELGSNSIPSLLQCCSPSAPTSFSEDEIRITLRNWRSISRLIRDFATAFGGSVRSNPFGKDEGSIGWIFIGKGMANAIEGQIISLSQSKLYSSHLEMKKRQIFFGKTLNSKLSVPVPKFQISNRAIDSKIS